MALLGYTSGMRFESMYEPEYYAGLYTNVLVDVDAFRAKHQHNNHGHHHTRRDEYDGDSNTVSQYDAMDHHQTWTNKERQDYFENRAEHVNKYGSFIQNKHQHRQSKRDAYDFDPTSASPYDSGANINGGNAYGIKSPYTDNDTEIGPKEGAYIEAIKKGYWWDKELEKELSRPAGEGQADARQGYSAAIPRTKSGELYCEGVGAKCDDHVEKSVASEAVANLKEGADPEGVKESEKVTEEIKAKKEKKEKKGEEETVTPGEEEKSTAVPVEPVKPKETKVAKEAAEEPAAFVQHRR